MDAAAVIEVECDEPDRVWVWEDEIEVVAGSRLENGEIVDIDDGRFECGGCADPERFDGGGWWSGWCVVCWWCFWFFGGGIGFVRIS